MEGYSNIKNNRNALKSGFEKFWEVMYCDVFTIPTMKSLDR